MAVGIHCADHTTPFVKAGTNFTDKQRRLGVIVHSWAEAKESFFYTS
jgi:hypothetical protein